MPVIYHVSRFIIILSLLIEISAVNLANATSIKHEKPAVIALNDWASQRVLSQVVGRLFTRMEVPFTYQQLKVADQWGAFRLGLVDVQVELWQGTSFEQFQRHIDKGFIIDAGNHGVNAREEWWYPNYVKPLCPGLPDWQALLKCQALFADKDSAGKGIYYSGHWNSDEGTRIRALGLNFIIRRLANDSALWKMLKDASEQKRPIMLLNWEPNWTTTRIQGEFVEFPSYHEKCITEAKWGLNKRLTNDCANPKSGWVKKVTTPDVLNRFPCAYRALKKVNFTTEMIAEAGALVINDGLSESQAAEQWIESYEPQWLSWIPEKCDMYR